MVDVKKIKRNKIKRNSLEEDRKSIFDDRLESENSNQHSNVKKVRSRKLNKSVVDENKNVDLIQKKRDKIVDQFILSKEQEAIYGEKVFKIGTRRIRGLEITREEQKLDRELENEDNLSITVMIAILVFCFIIGISLGYILYRIAMNSSNMMIIITHYLH